MEENLNLTDEDVRSILQNAADKAKENQQKKDQEREYEYTPPKNDFEKPQLKEELEEGEHSPSEMNNLLVLGKGQKTFEFWGNKITIRTLTQREEIDLMGRVSSFPDTSKDRAFAVYCASVCTESFNGEPVFKRLPLSKDQDMYTYKFDYFMDNISPLVTNRIIIERMTLDQEVIEQAEYAKKKSVTEESGTT